MPFSEPLLVEKLVRLGVEDPEGAARSEITEDIPQVAFARLERLVRTSLMRRRDSMDIWWANLQRERSRPDSHSAAIADVIAKCLDAGIASRQMGAFREVTGILQRISGFRT